MGNTSCSADTYAVVCDLGVQHFDEPRDGIAMARAAFDEMRRLGGVDPRVRATQWRRADRHTVQVTVTVLAIDPHQAYQVAGGLLRTGIHVVGGSTAGWERLRPELHVAPRRVQRPWRRSVPDTTPPPPPTWAGWSAAAQERLARLPALPPLAAIATPAAPQVIDLR